MPVRTLIDTTYSQVWDARTNAPSTTTVQRDVDGAFIPFDLGNLDYCAYLIWLDAGNQPTPYAPPPPDTLESET